MGYFSFGAAWVIPAFGLLAVPIIIHLINLMRHRRVEWAAMEFLLESQKKNSTYVLLKQLLLLLMRMAAVAAIVAIFGQLMWRTNLTILGGSETHHIVLLDDTFSMSEAGNETPFARAKNVIRRLGQQAANEEGIQRFTLLRLSQTTPDLSAQLVNTEFGEVLERKIKPLRTSHLASGPNEALGRALELIKQSEGESNIIYLLSDFRTNQWETPEDVKKTLKTLNEEQSKVVLVNCARDARTNLAVTSLRPVSRTYAAGVPMFLEVEVTNFDESQTAEEVPLLIYEDGNVRPGEQIDRIPPGESKTRRFQVHFPTAGEHHITVKLEPDAVDADNTRHLVLDFPLAIRTLLVDSDPAASDAKFLEAALNPGGPVRTGYAPQIEPPSFLLSEELDKFGVIYLANVEHLDRKAVENLETYVKNGGGLGIFLNERANPAFINTELYREGKGFFPAPVTGVTELLVDQLDPVPDLDLSTHAIFKEFATERNSLVDLVTVNHYMQVDPQWKPAEKSATAVIGRLRNSDPIAIESKYGEGRVVTFLTSVASKWNDWRKNPSFVFMTLELQSYLASGSGRDEGRVVGSQLALQFNQAEYAPQVRVVKPTADGPEPVMVDARLVDKDAGELEVALTDRDTATSGVYSVQLSNVEGESETRKFAFNVQPEEGDLKAVTGQQLATKLKGVNYELLNSDAFRWVGADQAGVKLVEWLLYALVALLLAEQLFAYFLSYHPATRVGT